jgi:hypothetical protein
MFAGCPSPRCFCIEHIITGLWRCPYFVENARDMEFDGGVVGAVESRRA